MWSRTESFWEKARRDRFLRRPPAGFTLLEIMVALAVISISFVALLGLRNRDIALAAYSRHLTEATLLARQKITEVSAAGFPDLGVSEGDFGEAYSRFRWEQEVKQTPFEVVRELVLTVVWMEGRREEETQFTLYLFKT
ncbi:MAG: prepilin-type N-terminal cleavage/methylation domain-containing protein [Nitrospiria bacterium]